MRTYSPVAGASSRWTGPSLVLLVTNVTIGTTDKNYYCVARKDRTYWGGGVMITLKSQYVADEIDLKLDGEIAWATIALANNHPMYIGVFYNNDGSSDNVDNLEKSLDEINTITKNDPRAFVSIGGDFNAPGVDWDSCFITPECRNIEACDTFNKFDLTQMQMQPTREKSIMDLYSANKPDLVKTFKAIPGISDHHAGWHECKGTDI